MLYSEWLHQIGMVYNKYDLILSSITKPGYFVLVIIAAYLCVVLVWQRRKLTISNKKSPILAVLLALTFFIIAFIPPTMWKQYLAMPAPFIIISFAFPLLYLRKLGDSTSPNKHFNTASALVAGCVLMAVASLPVVLHRVPRLFNAQSWVPIRLHKISEGIGEKTKSPKLILTLAPLFALEGGCDIYTELSCGPFAYRVADCLSAWNLDITHTAGPRTLEKLIEKSPPTVVILGVEPEFLEAPLFEAAVKPDRERWNRKIYKNGPVVYFRR